MTPTTQTPTATRSKADVGVEQKVQQLRDLYADASELGKVALETGSPLSSRS